MAFTWGAELGLILPVRTERDEPRRQFALLATKDLLHRTRQVIVAKPPEDALEILEGKFMRFQKSLLRRTLKMARRPFNDSAGNSFFSANGSSLGMHTTKGSCITG